MKLHKSRVIFGVLAVLCLSAGAVNAQDVKAGAQTDKAGRAKATFDPAQYQKRTMDSVRERLGFTNDVEWTAVLPLVQKVMDARSESRTSTSFGRGSRTSGFKTLAEADALQKTIDDKVPATQVKNALERYRAARKSSEAKLAAAQADLQMVLTIRQEAQASLMGLVP
jgi:hypothetical protein